MTKKDVTSMRGAIEWLKSKGELIEVDNEVDIVYEIAGIQAALEGGPALLFNNLKGFPGKRDIGNVFSRQKNVAKMFDLEDYKQVRFKCLEALRNPLPPRKVTNAPCQGVVITKNIDVLNTIPVTKYHPHDAGRILPNGNFLLTGKYSDGGTHIAFTRVHFRGKDWGVCMPSIGSTTEEICLKFKGEKIPCTINICNPPAVLMVASTGFVHTIVPVSSDKLGFAGYLQGAPVDIVKAKTVDAYSIANAEWVIEGYINTKEKRVWESEEGEKVGRQGVVPYFQEWTGYVGSAWRGLKFDVTAITHQKDRPIYNSPFSRSYDSDNMCSPYRIASFLELAERISPGLVADANIIPGLVAWGGSIIFQVNKRMARYEGYQRTVLAAAIANSFTLKLAIVVDEDVDITSADDVLWAIATRCNPATGIIAGAGGKVLSMLPLEKLVTGGVQVMGSRIEGAIGIDATLPFAVKQEFQRTRYPVDMVDLKKWFTKKQIDEIRATQTGFVKLWAERGG